MRKLQGDHGRIWSAVREIDGASHNSVDNVRDLIDSFRSLPAPGYRYKVYIIDEVHMLSLSAFNALLKSLEEPPLHTVFILATTEAHKIPDTVASRCQCHVFRSIGIDEIEDRLKHVAEAEGMTLEDGVCRLVARRADGSMRDAQTLLDKVQLFCEGKGRWRRRFLGFWCGEIGQSSLSLLKQYSLTMHHFV